MAERLKSYKLSPQLKAELHLNGRRNASDFSLHDAFEKVKMPKISWKAVALTVVIFGAVISSYIGIKHAYEIASIRTAQAKAAAQQEYENRLSSLQKEVASKGTDAFSFVELSQQYLKSSDGERAVIAAELSAQKDPVWSDGFVNLGQVYLSTNQFEKAKTALTEALKLNPLNGQGHYFLSLVYQELNDSASSKAEFAKAKTFGFDADIGG